MGSYSGDSAAREEALKKLNPSRITETPVDCSREE